jgi:chromosome segregation and condensation protein ScpB
MARQRAEFDDAELDELPEALRWREYMSRVEAVLFAAPRPVTRETLARVVGADVVIEALIADIGEDLRARPYEIVFVAGGWRFQTRKRFAPFIRAAAGAPASAALSDTQARVLTAIAYFQPLTRAELSQILCRDISRDILATLRETGLIGAGPRCRATIMVAGHRQLNWPIGPPSRSVYRGTDVIAVWQYKSEAAITIIVARAGFSG